MFPVGISPGCLLKTIQATRVLSYDIIQQCEIREIIVGKTSTSEIIKFEEWLLSMREWDDISLLCSVISLSIKTVKLTLRDVYRIAGILPMQESKMKCASNLQLNMDDVIPEDTWKKIPTKILLGNGVDWCAVISIDLGTAGKPWIQKIRIQQELVDLLNKLPVCRGVGIRGIIICIEKFYGILSHSLISIRSVDLEVIAHIAGWQLRGFSMTLMGVQALGTVLNRCVGGGEGKWGQKWEYISTSIVYALGNL